MVFARVAGVAIAVVCPYAMSRDGPQASDDAHKIQRFILARGGTDQR